MSVTKPSSKSFTDTYDWCDSGKGNLRAEFEPDGDGRWRVTAYPLPSQASSPSVSQGT